MLTMTTRALAGWCSTDTFTTKMFAVVYVVHVAGWLTLLDYLLILCFVFGVVLKQVLWLVEDIIEHTPTVASAEK